MDYHKLISDLPCLDAWYKESLRFDSPVVVPRYSDLGVHTDSVHIPPHTTILFDLGALNQGKKHWNQPQLFLPERFMPKSNGSTIPEDLSQQEQPHQLNQYPFLPFSTGSRMCPAFKVTECIFKSFIVHILKHYNLQPVTKDSEELILSLKPVMDTEFMVRPNQIF